jgi:hypothetical protein
MKEEFGDSKGVINQNPYIEKQATQWPKEKYKRTSNDLQLLAIPELLSSSQVFSGVRVP